MGQRSLRAADFIPEKMGLHKIWDRKKVIEAIHNLRRRKQQLNAHHVNKRNPGLFLARLRYYGRWNNALQVAGISITPTLKNSTARRNLQRTLRAKLHGVIGVELKLQAELYFGSVRNALK